MVEIEYIIAQSIWSTPSVQNQTSLKYFGIFLLAFGNLDQILLFFFFLIFKNNLVYVYRGVAWSGGAGICQPTPRWFSPPPLLLLTSLVFYVYCMTFEGKMKKLSDQWSDRFTKDYDMVDFKNYMKDLLRTYRLIKL